MMVRENAASAVPPVDLPASKSMRPVVSVVLPTHNGARHLRQSIESVLTQTFPNLELILVDDASTDDTPDIIADFKERDLRIRVVRHRENVKLPNALNSGFRVARGDYFTWTSDDNIYRPEAIAEMLAELEQHPEIGLVYADYSAIDTNGRVLRSVRVHPPGKLAYLNSVNACFLYRRQVHETIGDYDPAFVLSEDYEYWVRAAFAFKFRPLHKDLYLKRFHEESLTARFGEMATGAHERVMIRHLPHIRWATRADRASGYRLLADRAIHRGDFRTVAARTCSALVLAPLSTILWILDHLGRTMSNFLRNKLR